MYIDNSLTASIPPMTAALANYSSKYPCAAWDMKSLRDVRSGHDLKLVINFATPFTMTAPLDINNMTLEVNLETDDDPAFGSAIFTGRCAILTGAILNYPSPSADNRPLTLIVPLPPPLTIVSYVSGTLQGNAGGVVGAKYKRYIRIAFVARHASGIPFLTSATGTVSLVIDAQDGRQFYADAISTLPNPV